MKKFLLVCLCGFLMSCSGVRSAAVVPVQSKDKQLNCREILLEINEAEQYKIAAQKNLDPGIRSIIAPLGYMYTIQSAEDAISAADERIRYLQDVYNFSGCGSNPYGAGAPMPEDMRGHSFAR